MRKEGVRREEPMISSRRQDVQGPVLGPQTDLSVSHGQVYRRLTPVFSQAGGETDMSRHCMQSGLVRCNSRQLLSLYKRLLCLKWVLFIKYAFFLKKSTFYKKLYSV